MKSSICFILIRYCRHNILSNMSKNRDVIMSRLEVDKYNFHLYNNNIENY